MRIPNNNEQRLGTSDSHVKSLGITQETNSMTYINTNQWLVRTNLQPITTQPSVRVNSLARLLAVDCCRFFSQWRHWKWSSISVEEDTERCRSYNVDDRRKHMKEQTRQLNHCDVDGPLKELRHDILSRFQIEKFSLNFSIWLFVIRVNLRHP